MTSILCIWIVRYGCKQSSGKAFAEHYGELNAGRKPFQDILAILRKAADRRVDQLLGFVVGRERHDRAWLRDSNVCSDAEIRPFAAPVG